jgi:multimeric flavodoxin WrbA
MKIVLLNGSPRKGATYEYLRRLETAFRGAGYETDVMSLGDYRLTDCAGCYACVTAGKEFCPAKDDAEILWDKIRSADGVVLSSPVYALGVTGTMKTFMDKIAYNAHRPTFGGKPAVILSTTAGMGTEEVARQLRWFEITGMRVVGSLGIQLYPGRQFVAREEVRVSRNLDVLARKLDAAIRNASGYKPSLVRVIQFYGLKANCDFDDSAYKADRAYYAGRDFFPGARAGAVKNAIGRWIYGIALRMMAKKWEGAAR